MYICKELFLQLSFKYYEIAKSYNCTWPTIEAQIEIFDLSPILMILHIYVYILHNSK